MMVRYPIKRLRGVGVVLLAVFISCSLFAADAYAVKPTKKRLAKIKEMRTEELSVVDANGIRLGKAYLLPTGVRVVLQVEGIVFGVDMHTNGFSGEPDGLYFESENCTGTPYVIFAAFNAVPLQTKVVLAGPRDGVYIPVDPITPDSGKVMSMRAVGSFLYRQQPCYRLAPSERTDAEHPMIALKQVANLLDLFTPPFRLQSGVQEEND